MQPIFAVLLIILLPLISSTEIYVTPNSTGTFSGNGTFENPYTFLPMAVGLAQDYDTIVLMPGVFEDPLSTTFTATKILCFVAQNGFGSSFLQFPTITVEQSTNFTGIIFGGGINWALNIASNGSTFYINNCQFKDSNDVAIGTFYTFPNQLLIVNSSFLNNRNDIDFEMGTLDIINSNFIGSSLTLTNSLSIDGPTNVNIQNSNFTHYNDAVIIMFGGKLIIDGCNFTSNLQQIYPFSTGGGAIYLQSGSMQISDSLFYNNTASDGGAIYLVSSTMFMTSTNFTNNVAISGDGSAYACKNSTAVPVECIFNGDSPGSSCSN